MNIQYLIIKMIGINVNHSRIKGKTIFYTTTFKIEERNNDFKRKSDQYKIEFRENAPIFQK